MKYSCAAERTAKKWNDPRTSEAESVYVSNLSLREIVDMVMYNFRKQVHYSREMLTEMVTARKELRLRNLGCIENTKL